MENVHGIVYSRDNELIRLCQTTGARTRVQWAVEDSIPRFLRFLQENHFKLILFDLESVDPGNGVEWIRFIRNFRPKIPCIVVATEVSRELGAELSSRGIFYTLIRPLHEDLFLQVIQAALEYHLQRM